MAVCTSRYARIVATKSISKDVSYNRDSQMTTHCHPQTRNAFSSDPFLRARCHHISLHPTCGFDSEYISMIAEKERDAA